MDNLRLAVVGHPNEGKTSVVSTLAERKLRISKTPGETEFATPITIQVDEQLLTIVDTPGFQTPKKTRKWVEDNASGFMVSEWVHGFEATYRLIPQYKHDIRVLHEMGRADGIIYVVDASKPIGPDDEAEMTVIRKTGLPRIVVFNNKKNAGCYIQEWRRVLGESFPVQHVFNALHARFSERVALFEKLKVTFPTNEDRVENLIEGLKEDRKARIIKTAEFLHQLLDAVLTTSVSIRLHEKRDKAHEEKRLREKLRDKVCRLERKAHKEIKKLYNYAHLSVEGKEVPLLDRDLFSEEIIRVLGLDRKQLSVAGAVAGASVGVMIDVALGEITFGIFMATGAAVGAVSAALTIAPLSKVNLRIKSIKAPIGDHTLQLRVRRVDQLPYLLVDRVMLLHALVSDRPHARQDDPWLEEYGESLTTKWPADDRAKLTAFCSRIIKGKLKDNDRSDFVELLIDRIRGHGDESYVRESEIDDHYKLHAEMLGFPLHEERECGGDQLGRYRTYDRGSIHYHPDTGAHETHGAIRERWAQENWQDGWLGYPVTDEQEFDNMGSDSTSGDGAACCTNSGRVSYFQNGAICWDRDTNQCCLLQRPDGDVGSNARYWQKRGL